MGQIEELRNRFKIKELELNSLLEITQAINSNLSEDAIIKIFDFTLRGNLNVKKLVLYVLGEKWEAKANFGTEDNFFDIELPSEFNDVKSIISIESPGDKRFGVFDTLIPVTNKGKDLACLFVNRNLAESSETSTTYLQAITNIIIVAIENKRLAERQLKEEALRKELEIAKNVQNFLFPENLPYGIRLKLEASYLPHHSVGGDYYDYIPINPNQFLICIADVSGKGVPAAIIMSNFQATLRTMIRQTPNLLEIVEALNYQLLEHAKGENFITFFAAIYDHKLKTMVYINSGHNHPILMDNKTGIKMLDEGSTILGVFHPLPFINEGFITDLEDFYLFLYTDGVTETSNNKGEEYGVERLVDFISNNMNKDLRKVHKEIIASLDAFKGSKAYHDDITMLSCRIKI